MKLLFNHIIAVLLSVCFFNVTAMGMEDTILIEKTYLQLSFFEAEKELSIAKYRHKVPTGSSEEDPIFLSQEEDKETILIGLFDQKTDLVSPLLQMDYLQTPSHKMSIHSIKTKDLNSDGRQDLIINITETGEGFYRTTMSNFFINKRVRIYFKNNSFKISCYFNFSFFALYWYMDV